MLEVKDISFSYDKKEILKNINLSLSPRELVIITAPSGFGKSTLGKIIAGYLEPDKGEIIVDGKDIKNYKGYLPVQMAFQHPEKAINRRWKIGRILNEGWDVNRDIIEKFGIKDYWLEKYPQELSGGELQRICLARIMSNDTKYLVLDEITTMVDAITQVQLFEVLDHFRLEHNMGMVLITHNKKLIEKLNAKVIELTAF
ncbi:ABC transporter ATP-binding protein [Anaerococcus sp. mt242]|uniref:ABC transporter ATP-binding protein n=1 Tax=Anaerococcus sp. mt242 TaxID=2661917 RepID=UPI001933B1E1|nr:ATP-binding cassette domain-containing protein [Anaerococcus sp. mt242]MBM0046467.1 ATP-binding cassette domain-containing protein [Anaerococcus sp. mt242]